jgi:alkanesulfonate monooxygenase SsuD/methylene tetrahydromethanopterin reductase-like flavin-dependent oxidoreductase (luciferase family)
VCCEGGMRIGVVFPQTDLGGDAGVVRAWAQRVGARSPRALRRAGRLADGWFPQMAPGPGLVLYVKPGFRNAGSRPHVRMVSATRV